MVPETPTKWSKTVAANDCGVPFAAVHLQRFILYTLTYNGGEFSYVTAPVLTWTKLICLWQIFIHRAGK